MEGDGDLVDRIAEIWRVLKQELAYRRKCRMTTVAVVGLGHHVEFHSAFISSDNAYRTGGVAVRLLYLLSAMPNRKGIPKNTTNAKKLYEEKKILRNECMLQPIWIV